MAKSSLRSLGLVRVHGLGLALPTAEEVPRTLRRDLAKMQLFCRDYVMDLEYMEFIDQIALSIR
jgi:hypothetical protein